MWSRKVVSNLAENLAFGREKILFGSKTVYHDVAKSPDRLQLFISSKENVAEYFSLALRDFNEIGTFDRQISGQI